MLSDIETTSPVRMRGWHHGADFCRAKTDAGEMIHLLAETSNICDQDCEYCYTVLVTLDKANFHHSSLPGELSLEERKLLIDKAAGLGAVTYDIVGAGEPLTDKLFLRQVEHASARGMIPVVFTNGSVLGHPVHGERFGKALLELGATVVVKWHSKDHDLHDEIVRRKGAGVKRDRAIELLKRLGFNQCTPTRLGIDNIVYQRTIAEIPDCLRMCREENLFLVCSTFIPSGRTQKGYERESSYEDIARLYEQARAIDQGEFGIEHTASMPYIGYGKTCTQYMGMYVTIQGDAHGCVGQSESYGNIRHRPLEEMWRERVPLLRTYDGGCPPRELHYQQLVPLARLQSALFPRTL